MLAYLSSMLSPHQPAAPQTPPPQRALLQVDYAQRPDAPRLSALDNAAFSPARCVVHPLPHSIRTWKGKEQFAIVIDNVLTPEECQRWIDETEANGYGEALVSVGIGVEVKMKDYRNSSRCIIDDEKRAADLYERIQSFIPQDIAAVSHDLEPAFLNERLRFLRYDVGEHFDTHQDGRFTYPHGHVKYGHTSLLTFQLYLNEGFEGGSTRFFTSYDEVEYFDVIPKTGSVLIFEHRMIHSGEKVTAGRKYAVRTDVMFSPIKDYDQFADENACV
jgi:predicted 2-oxoglutarate/Fe(II)-dependent dioxygenase YbiX